MTTFFCHIVELNSRLEASLQQFFNQLQQHLPHAPSVISHNSAHILHSQQHHSSPPCLQYLQRSSPALLQQSDRGNLVHPVYEFLLLIVLQFSTETRNVFPCQQVKG